jgi:transcriptional antiterminator RfaH
LSWKALYVASRAEKKINDRLTETGIESYLPLKKEKKQWSDRKKIVITPLISGYVFVNVNEHNRDAVFNVKGVLQYVRYNGGDAEIREEEINAMKSIEHKGYYAEGRLGADLNEGDMAVIKYGPFKGLQGKIENKNSESVYTISISSIGYSLTIKIPNEVLEKK